MKQFSAWLAVLGAGFILSGTVFAATPQTPGKISPQQCVDCHKPEVQSHGNHAYHGECASCHVRAADHATAEEAKEKAPRGSKPQSVPPGLPESAQCLACHETDKRRMHFAFAEHHKAGVQCRDCHGNHAAKIQSLNAGMAAAGKNTALCATCHQDILARFSMNSHHPVKEGGNTCVSCHDPHASKQTTLGEATTQCTVCHQAIRGPHVFEHPPAVEDCKNCHDPHGSPNRRLLTLAQPMQCLQCHSIASNRHGQTGAANNTQTLSGAILRDCASCHGALHGSSVDQHLRH